LIAEVIADLIADLAAGAAAEPIGSRQSTMDKPHSTICIRQSAIETWAHQDSNLGRAGYEPAALTAELWAR
jgi:hypothetical protein